MNAEDWMLRGYLNCGEDYSPPNHPVAKAAYDHGWRSGEADRGNPRNEDIATTRAKAAAILAADKVAE